MIPIRDENPASIVPFVTYGLIAACVAVYGFQMSLSVDAVTGLVHRHGVVPTAMFANDFVPSNLIERLLPLFSSAFLHGGPLHLAGNMLFLWIFGNNVEDAMGHVRFFIFYMVAGAAAMLAQAVPDMASSVPIIGASGAISGVLGAYLLLFPTARVSLLIWLVIFVRIFKMPAAILLIAWFVLQLASSATVYLSEQVNIAFNAHIGGFLAGMVLVVFFKSRDFALHNPITAIMSRSNRTPTRPDDDSAVS